MVMGAMWLCKILKWSARKPVRMLGFLRGMYMVYEMFDAVGVFDIVQRSVCRLVARPAGRLADCLFNLKKLNGDCFDCFDNIAT